MNKAAVILAIGNPFSGLQDSIDRLNKSVDNFIYWINPGHWFEAACNSIYNTVHSGSLDVPFLILTIVAIWAVMLGANRVKKWTFWAWVGFWILRGLVI